jgi:chitinase
MWSKGSLPPQAIRYDYLTHVMHAFAWPNADGSISSYDATVDTALIRSTHRQGRKILISLGGASESGAFPIVTADTALRRTFINNIVLYVIRSEYDGVDLDWEGPQSTAERNNESAFVRELRGAIRMADSALLITMAVGVTDWSGRWHDFAALKQYVDWFNAMTYDFHGSWSSDAGYNAPLYAPPGDPDGSVDIGIKYLHQTRGIPGTQLALGLPFYGRRFHASAPYGPKTEPTIDIFYSDALYDLGHNWTYNWDTLSQVPWLRAPSGTMIDSFDDTTSLTIKCNYARVNGLSGVMIWALGQDLTPSGQPLLEAVGKAMTSAMAVRIDDNHFLPDRPLLLSAYPNPFNPSTTVRYVLVQRAEVRLEVFDLLGRHVANLAEGIREAGIHEEVFNGGNIASGVYLCRMSAGKEVQMTKLVLIK